MGEEDTMRTRVITRPTLANLWRQILAILESLGASDAPAVARSLAISGLMGRPASTSGVGVKREGDVYTITFPERSSTRIAPAYFPRNSRRTTARRRIRVLAGR
jgi:hypothetical protein